MKQKIYIAGHKGMLGAAIVRSLENINSKIIYADRKDLDLTNQKSVRDFMQNENPDQVYIAAARVGGIHANNTLPAQFIYENLMIESNIIHESWLSGCKKLLFLGSSCIYPKHCSQPMSEEELLSGPLESTNEPYAIAKIAGIKLCQSYNRQYGIDYRCVMPTNLYGAGDNYHAEHSHVIPGLIRRFHEAKINGHSSVSIWGTGKPLREFLYVDDLADACLKVMNMPESKYQDLTKENINHLNVGSGFEVSISELADIVKKCVGFEGQIHRDTSMPDGTPRKMLNSKRIMSSGWKPKVNLEDGIRFAYEDYLNRSYKEDSTK